MTSNKDLFTTISLIHSIIIIANNKTILAKEIRTVKVKIKNQKGKTVNIIIYRVLYILKYSENLLLEGQLNEQRIEITIKNSKKFFKKERKLVVTATQKGRI